MSDLLTALVHVAPTVAVIIVAWLGRGVIHRVHLQLNSRLDQLIEAARLQGVVEGAKAERERRLDEGYRDAE